MLVLSDVLTALGVVLLVCAIWTRRHRVISGSLMSIMFCAQGMSLGLQDDPWWWAFASWVLGAAECALVVAELVRQHRAEDAAWCEICPCCEHPDDATGGA